MPIYTIQTPDGRKLKIEAGDEATAIRGAQEWSQANPPAQIQERAPITADYMMELARKQFAPDPSMAPRVEGNPYASSLPGPLGQLQNSMAAQQQGMIEGLTGNFSNEITSGLMAVPDAAIQAAQGNGFDVGRSFHEVYQQGQKAAEGRSALNPKLAQQGNILGAMVTGSRIPSLMANARTPLGMLLAGGAEGGIYGAVYEAGKADGAGRIGGALQGAGQGAAGGAALGGLAGRFQQPISQEARLLTRGLQREGIDPASVNARIAAIGPDAMYADIGANQQMQAAALATTPGPGARTVVEALTARRQGANNRVRGDVAAALGPVPRPAEVAAEVRAGQDALGPRYEDVLRNKALSNNPFMDATPIVAAIDGVIPSVVGRTRSRVEQVRNMLIDPRSGAPTRDPGIVMAVRRELDGMIPAETNTTTAGILVDLRKAIDQDLGMAVPGLKSVDAQFQDLARQSEANARGTTILRDGVTQASPADLAQEIAEMYLPSGVNVGPNAANAERLQQGLVSDINRVVGQASNDRVKLRNLIRGEGSWNYENIAQVLGPRRADELMNILNREARMAETENLATAGSRTQVIKAAQEDINPAVSGRGVVQEALNSQYGNAFAKVIDQLAGGAISRSREGVLNNVAGALVGRGLPPEMQAQMSRLVHGMSPHEKAIVTALMATQASR